MSLLYVCLLIFENILAWPYLDQSEGIQDFRLTNEDSLLLGQSGGTLTWPIRRHSCSTNQEALWPNQSGGILADQSGGTLDWPIRRYSGSIAFWLNQWGGNMVWKIRRLSCLTNQKVLKFAHQEALKFGQSGGIMVLPIRKHSSSGGIFKVLPTRSYSLDEPWWILIRWTLRQQTFNSKSDKSMWSFMSSPVVNTYWLLIDWARVPPDWSKFNAS